MTLPANELWHIIGSYFEKFGTVPLSESCDNYFDGINPHIRTNSSDICLHSQDGTGPTQSRLTPQHTASRDPKRAATNQTSPHRGRYDDLPLHPLVTSSATFRKMAFAHGERRVLCEVFLSQSSGLGGFLPCHTTIPSESRSVASTKAASSSSAESKRRFWRKKSCTQTRPPSPMSNSRGNFGWSPKYGLSH